MTTTSPAGQRDPRVEPAEHGLVAGVWGLGGHGTKEMVIVSCGWTVSTHRCIVSLVVWCPDQRDGVVSVDGEHRAASSLWLGVVLLPLCGARMQVPHRVPERRRTEEGEVWAGGGWGAHGEDGPDHREA